MVEEVHCVSLEDPTPQHDGSSHEEFTQTISSTALMDMAGAGRASVGLRRSVETLSLTAEDRGSYGVS